MTSGSIRKGNWSLWALVLGVISWGCASSGPVGGESHFFCSRDDQCSVAMPSCTQGACRAATETPPADLPDGGGSTETGTSLVGTVISDASSPVSTGAGGTSPVSSPSRTVDAAPAPCVPLVNGPTFTGTDCHQLDSLILENPKVVDANGDGIVSPGEVVNVSVDWRETKGINANNYPQATIFLDGATRTEIGGFQAYAVLACQTLIATGTMVVPESAPLGTVYKLKAQVTLLAGELVTCPDADSIDFSFTVGARVP